MSQQTTKLYYFTISDNRKNKRDERLLTTLGKKKDQSTLFIRCWARFTSDTNIMNVIITSGNHDDASDNYSLMTLLTIMIGGN